MMYSGWPQRMCALFPAVDVLSTSRSHPFRCMHRKTCLLLRYAHDSFSPTFITTIGIDFKIKYVDIGGTRTKLQIWDTGACRVDILRAHDFAVCLTEFLQLDKSAS